MMKTSLSTLALIAALGLCGAASAQVPSGASGSDAKGNAPLKPAHTVDDGMARRGANSFTESQARRHIVHAGYESVTGLTKGKDGVWRGTATKGGAPVNVGLDFKGNVSEGSAMSSTTASTTTAGAMTTSASSSTTSTTDVATAHDATSRTASHHRRHHRRHRACTDAKANGAACSGVDRNANGISDREDRAIKGGARP